MMITDHQLFTKICPKTTTNKIVLLVMDGLGGMPLHVNGLTELETAYTPNLDRMAREGSSGRSIPIRPGVTPGSGPAHLSLFSYDPVRIRDRPGRAGSAGHRLRLWGRTIWPPAATSPPSMPMA